jgi:hypothetical protein
MDYHKLKLDKYSSYNGVNMPSDFLPPLSLSDNPEVYFMFVSSISEIMNALNIVQNNQSNKDNRVFFVFKKGNKSFGRDHIYNIIMKNKNFIRKAPILASLNKAYSVFCFSYII